MKVRIKQIVQELFYDDEIEVVDVLIRGSARNRIIEILVDRDGGVLLDDCAKLSRKLADHLELLESELGLDKYRLEVSSPGLTRPLKTRRDFKRNIQRRVKIEWKQEGRTQSLEGRIIDAEEMQVKIELKKSTAAIPYEDIEKAVIQIDWNC
ncbi:hypothetical protein KAR48_04660 [bacterium]|nr:hypothetical protein [bacterium]